MKNTVRDRQAGRTMFSHSERSVFGSIGVVALNHYRSGKVL